jgi:hypothetical protein
MGSGFFLFLGSGFLGRGISLALEFSFSLPCLKLLLGVVRVYVHTTVVFDYHKSSDVSS